MTVRAALHGPRSHPNAMRVVGCLLPLVADIPEKVF